MSLTKLNVSLEEYEIGLTGAVPEIGAWSEPAMDRSILEFVSLFCGMVFKYGGRIVHGSHPAFTPIILRQARLQAANRPRKPVTLVMSELWAKDRSVDELGSLRDIAELVITKQIGYFGVSDSDTRNRSLAAMRRVLVDSQNLMVAVGGISHSGDGLIPGVGEEMELAGIRGIPRFLIAGLGGFSSDIAKELAPSSLRNSLSDKANLELFSTNDVAASVNVVFNHLAKSKALAKSALQPIKWNPELKMILDHRDGTIYNEATQYILRVVAG
jgi:SLOG cluster2